MVESGHRLQMTPIRPLIIDDVAKAKVAAVLEHASKHHYRLGPGVPAPGDDPRFVARLDSYRAVFTFTQLKDTLWRHLSVSVPGPKYPNPAAVFTIAELFGFTGWDGKTLNKFPDGWLGQVNEQDHCVVVGQPVQLKAPKSLQ